MKRKDDIDFMCILAKSSMAHGHSKKKSINRAIKVYSYLKQQEDKMFSKCSLLNMLGNNKITKKIK